ncbi:MAG: large conductance mechanosensitive channel protein MscL [Clostridia bacterium]|nr:large conductance mechanosensitive channel protein MscL [Clostridia bacterium]
MRKFFGEFKKFITRGNVLDMAVGVIVGGAFTGIVNGLSNYVLKPIINWFLALILGSEGLSGAITMLSAGYTADGALDLASSIYIDWGAFISSVINFFIVALVLFTIVKVMNNLRENNGKITEAIKKNTLNKNERKELKKAGISLKNKQAIKEYFDEKEKEKAKVEEEAKKAEEEKARLARLENPTVEDLLKDIKAILEKKQ